jgi:hypothetical protein
VEDDLVRLTIPFILSNTLKIFVHDKPLDYRSHLRPGSGPAQRNFFLQIMQHATELVVSQRTWPPSVSTHALRDQERALAEHRAMRSSSSSKHDASAVVSEDTIAEAAAEPHADDGSGAAARSSRPRRREALPFSAGPHPSLHPTMRQLGERHAGHAIHHAGPRGHGVRYIPNWRSRGPPFWSLNASPTSDLQKLDGVRRRRVRPMR